MDFLGLLFVFLLATMVGSLADALAPWQREGAWPSALIAAAAGAIVGGAILGSGDPAVGGVHVFWALAGALLAAVLTECALYLSHRRRTP